jgi:hypothetical protein
MADPTVKELFNNIQSWQALLGYVPQTTVLINDQTHD